jgi:hypothetical protein
VNKSVKRIIALAALWLCAAFAIAQAPIGVCINNVAQTISNGVIAPIPYATVALCSSGSTAANCVANKVSIYTTTALSTATPTNPFTADVGGNYYFCAHVGHYGLLINSPYGQYFVPDVALVDDWSTGGTMTGALTDASGFIGPLTGNVTGNVSGNAATATNATNATNAVNASHISNVTDVGATGTWYVPLFDNATGTVSAYTKASALMYYPSSNFLTVNVTHADAATNATHATTADTTTGNAGTASALAAAPSVLTSPAVSKGVDASGNAIAQTFVGSLGSTGYMTLPGGLILQWGSLGGLADNGVSSGSLPYNFPNSCFKAFATEDESVTASRPGNPRNIAASCSTSTITLWASGSGSTGSWFAIGN